MNIIEQYIFNKTRIKIIKNYIEIYENNYLNLDKKENLKFMNKLSAELNNLIEFNKKYDIVYNSLNETEKFFIEERYFKNRSLKEISYFYSKNQELVSTISLHNSELKKVKSSTTLHVYLCKFNRNILVKLERGVLLNGLF